MNEIVLYQESAGITILPNVADVSELISYNKSLAPKDAQKVVKAYEKGL